MKPAPFEEKDLHHWKFIESFQEAIDKVFSQKKLHPTFEDPKRLLSYKSYLSTFLFGLFNPVIESMRGLCEATKLKRVKEEISGRKISLGSFSETQALLDPQLLREVFFHLVEKTQTQAKPDPRMVHLNLIVQDSSLWSALPRMAWAQYGVGRKGEAKGVRFHLRFNVCDDKPVDLQITPGASCERKALREMLKPGQVNVGDRYYGEDYQLFGEIDQAKGFFVFRFKEGAVIHVEEELELTPEDKAAGVVRHLWARLGARESTRSIRLRVVEIRACGQHLLLATNLSIAEASAELVGAIYRRRWSIELFFRWIKCIFKARHFFAESPAGAAIQLYLALIASVLLQDCTGHRPSKRIMELLQFYTLGWATAEEVVALIQKHLAPKGTKKG